MNEARFNCSHLENALDDYLAQTLSPRRKAALEAHLMACPACAELVEIARTSREVLSGSDISDFTASVLAATTGSACERAQQLIGDRADGLLDEMDRQLLRGHLDNCPECAALATTWSWLAPELREMGTMGEMAPDPVFIAEVLDRTSRARRPADAVAEWIQAWWQRQIRRPRFVLEMAYVATLLVVALCGTPVSPLRDVPGRAQNMVQAAPMTAFGDIVAPMRGIWSWSEPARDSMWEATGGRVGTAVSGIGDRIEETRRENAPFWRRVSGHGRIIGSSLKAGEWSDALSGIAALGDEVQDEWNERRRPQADEARGTE